MQSDAFHGFEDLMSHNDVKVDDPLAMSNPFAKQVVSLKQVRAFESSDSECDCNYSCEEEELVLKGN